MLISKMPRRDLKRKKSRSPYNLRKIRKRRRRNSRDQRRNREKLKKKKNTRLSCPRHLLCQSPNKLTKMSLSSRGRLLSNGQYSVRNQ